MYPAAMLSSKAGVLKPSRGLYIAYNNHFNVASGRT